MSEPFIAAEVGSLQFAVGGYEMRVLVAVELMAHLVPVEFLTLEAQTVDCAHTHPATQLPQLELVVEIGCIALYVCLHVEFLVELLKEESALEYPTRRIAHSIDLPSF